MTMKILVLGAGAIGAYYGARLIEAGADVSFLLRAPRAAALAAGGMRVKSALGDFHAQVPTLQRIAAPATYDVVLLACKTYDLEAAIEAIAPAVEGGALVLPFLNGLAAYDKLDARFGKDRVLGGVAYIATMMEKDGGIVHYGSNDVVVLGARSEAGRGTAAALHALFAATPGVRKLSDAIEQALWDKWVMIASAAMMNTLMRATVAGILATRDGKALMVQAMAECRAVAAASGHPLADAVMQQMDGRLLDKKSEWAASMMRDIDQDAPRLEGDDVVGDMLARARAHGLAAPLLTAAFCHLQAYQGRQQRKSAAA
jgi:2-dehydropantoate 2-reductase